MSKFHSAPRPDTLEWFEKIGIDYTNARRIEIVFEVGAAVKINIERFADDALIHEEPPQELKEAIVTEVSV
jgi:argininosuccinate synthase